MIEREKDTRPLWQPWSHSSRWLFDIRPTQSQRHQACILLTSGTCIDNIASLQYQDGIRPLRLVLDSLRHDEDVRGSMSLILVSAMQSIRELQRAAMPLRMIGFVP
jgi:cell division inhibitor SulA